MAGWKDALARYVDGILRDNRAVTIRYTNLPKEEGIYHAQVSIGSKVFYGSDGFLQRGAQRSAAFNAYETLKDLSGEDELRQYLGLSMRKKIREIDEVRDCLRRLKWRIRGRFDQPVTDEAMVAIGKLYAPLDKMERDLIECTGMFD